MSKQKTIWTLALVGVLGGLCFYLNRDSFRENPIQISYRVSPWLKSPARTGTRSSTGLGVPVVFSLDTYYQLTGVKVLVTAEAATNAYPHPLWELTSHSNSVPTASFAYGERIRGMLPKVKGATPDPLEPGVMYRLMLTTVDKKTAQRDFSTTPPPSPASVSAH